MTRKVGKQRAESDQLKPQQRRSKPAPTGNKRVAEQVRKILRTHYASKYRVR
ncbi:MAG TPA: hypothetical protein VFE34_14870 [Dongiaceae bacterium]|nr:hypothetical protein [Dongiaceae bacterium]